MTSQNLRGSTGVRSLSVKDWYKQMTLSPKKLIEECAIEANNPVDSVAVKRTELGLTPICFEIFNGQDFVRIVNVEWPVLKIGNNEDAQLRIEGDNRIAYRHAFIQHEQDGIYLFDMCREPRTQINCKEICGVKVKLKSGDTISIGQHTRIIVRIGEEDVKDARR